LSVVGLRIILTLLSLKNLPANPLFNTIVADRSPRIVYSLGMPSFMRLHQREVYDHGAAGPFEPAYRLDPACALPVGACPILSLEALQGIGRSAFCWLKIPLSWSKQVRSSSDAWLNPAMHLRGALRLGGMGGKRRPTLCRRLRATKWASTWISTAGRESCWHSSRITRIGSALFVVVAKGTGGTIPKASLSKEGRYPTRSARHAGKRGQPSPGCLCDEDRRDPVMTAALQ
jgi:hypothetical protein